MSAVVSILPILLVLVAYAGFVKLAARLYRKSQLPWKYAFGFAVLASVAGALGSFVHSAAGAQLPLPAAAMASFGVQVVVGGWFLGPRSITPSGASVSFKGGAVIALVAAAFAIVCAFLGALLLPALLPPAPVS